MDFEDAGEAVKRFSKKPPDAIMLEFYGLYKQATVGDCNIPAPTSGDKMAEAKYTEWMKYKGMQKMYAQVAYVDLYKKYAPEYL